MTHVQGMGTGMFLLADTEVSGLDKLLIWNSKATHERKDKEGGGEIVRVCV